MKRSIRGWRLGVLASFVVLVVVALGAGAGQSALGGASQSGVLISGTTDSITNIDPAGNYDFGTFTLGINFYRASVRRQERRQARAVARDGLRPVRTTRTWRCTLRRGVKFHDGSDFDSADVKFSFDRVSNPQVVKQAAANTPSLAALQPQEREDEREVRRYVQPQVPGVDLAVHPVDRCGRDRPEHAIRETKLQANNQPQIGTGPYRLTKYTPGQQAVFEPFDDYWGPQAKNDGLILRYYSKSSTMKLALERGEIDMAFQTFTPTELTSLKKARNVRVHQGPGAVIRYLALNVEREPTTTSRCGGRSRT